MGYCKASDIKTMIKPDMLSSLLGANQYIEDAEALTQLEPIIGEAILDADAEIDGYLCSRYPVPLSVIPAMISKLSKDIAVYNLVSRSGIDESERESNYLTRYKAAVSYLKLVTEGKADIGLPSGDAGGTAAPTSKMHFACSKKIFGRSNMSGM